MVRLNLEIPVDDRVYNILLVWFFLFDQFFWIAGFCVGHIQKSLGHTLQGRVKPMAATWDLP